jgi:hypothetical protein
MFILVMPLYG